MNHSINLTHDGTLIVRVPKGYKVEKVKVETFEGEEIPIHTTPSNTLGALDCISRQAVKDWIKRWEGYLDQDMIARMQYRVVDIPSADLSSYSDKLYALAYERGKAEGRPRKGKWIYAGIRGRFPTCSCSVCGSKENADWAIMQGANFCPNCGADMRERKEDE